MFSYFLSLSQFLNFAEQVFVAFPYAEMHTGMLSHCNILSERNGYFFCEIVNNYAFLLFPMLRSGLVPGNFHGIVFYAVKVRSLEKIYFFESLRDAGKELLLPSDKLKRLTRPDSLGMAQILDEGNRVIGGVLIVMGRLRHKRRRFIFSEFSRMLTSSLRRNKEKSRPGSLPVLSFICSRFFYLCPSALYFFMTARTLSCSSGFTPMEASASRVPQSGQMRVLLSALDTAGCPRYVRPHRGQTEGVVSASFIEFSFPAAGGPPHGRVRQSLLSPLRRMSFLRGRPRPRQGALSGSPSRS